MTYFRSVERTEGHHGSAIETIAAFGTQLHARLRRDVLARPRLPSITGSIIPQLTQNQKPQIGPFNIDTFKLSFPPNLASFGIKLAEDSEETISVEGLKSGEPYRGKFVVVADRPVKVPREEAMFDYSYTTDNAGATPAAVSGKLALSSDLFVYSPAKRAFLETDFTVDKILSYVGPVFLGLALPLLMLLLPVKQPSVVVGDDFDKLMEEEDE